MNQSTAQKTRDNGQESKSHVLTLPLENTHVDRSPHTYERWLIAKLMRMAGSPPLRFRLWNGDVIEPEGQHA